jgi:predicted kinase
VILIGGYAGSGKTELGRILARQTGWPILDKDTTTRPVVEAALESLDHSPNDRESELYLKVIRPAEYESLVATLNENVQCGNSAVVTAPFIRELADEAWCSRLAANLASLGAELHVVWVKCDAESMRTYIKHRGAARDAAKLAAWGEYLASIDLDFRPAIRHRIIDNSADSRPLQQQAADLLDDVVPA